MQRRFSGIPASSREGAVRILGIDPGSRITGYGIVELVGQKARSEEHTSELQSH